MKKINVKNDSVVVRNSNGDIISLQIPLHQDEFDVLAITNPEVVFKTHTISGSKSGSNEAYFAQINVEENMDISKTLTNFFDTLRNIKRALVTVSNSNYQHYK